MKSLIVVLSFLMCCSGARGAGAEPRDYFPLSVGSTWKYKTYENTVPKKYFIMNVTMANGIMVQKDKRGTMRSFLDVSDKGIFIKKTGVKKGFSPEINAVQKPPIPLFLFSLSPGTTAHWEGMMSIAWVKKKIIMDIKILPEEEITVPAGTFTCIKIYFHQKRNNEIIDEYAWYAAGVGQVKYIGGQYTKELLEYHIK